MKKSIARKLALRVSAAIAITFMLLLGGAYISLDRQVKVQGIHYAKVLSGILADVVIYESRNTEKPVDISFNERLSFFGGYMCTFYRVDYCYAYVPDFEDGTITYLSVARNRKKFGDLADEHMVGVTEKRVFSDDEIRAWNDSTIFAIIKNDRFEKATDVLIMLHDDFGNKAMVGSAVSTDEQRKDVLYSFLTMALLVFVVAVLLSALLFFLIRRKVTDPAKYISGKMSDYISGGKRSKIKMDKDDDDEFSMIAGAFNHMTDDIDNYVDDIARLGREQERQQAEVDIASQIQKGILPPKFAYLKNCAIEGVMKPARFIGGDLFDYLEIDGIHTMMVVADVSGKGIPSAMFMAMALTLIRQFAKMGYGPAEILDSVNSTLSAENREQMFITAFVGIYDAGNSTLTYANAGHNTPYLVRDDLIMLEGSDGTPLGLFPDEEYADVVIPVQEGDSVFLYTDGVNEAVNPSMEFYGTQRLENVLRETARLPKRHFIEAIEESLTEFCGDAEQSDDITMLSILIRERKVLELNYDIGEFSIIRNYLLSSSIPKSVVMELCVAAEECFVNICSYAFDGPAPEGEKILFELDYSNTVTMRFSDGGRRFDPRYNLPDTEQYDIDTAVGGLGRLIAFTVADSVDYEYKDGRNILTITKSISK